MMMMRSVCLCLQVCKNVCSLCLYLSIYACFVCVCMCGTHDKDMCVIVCKRMCACVLVEVLYVCVSLRHGRCFWFSGQSGGDHCKAGVSEGGVASMHGFRAVWRQDAAILPHTSCDGQTGLVPHGFRERQLLRGEMEGRSRRRVEMAEWRCCLKKKKISAS